MSLLLQFCLAPLLLLVLKKFESIPIITPRDFWQIARSEVTNQSPDDFQPSQSQIEDSKI